MDLKQIVAVFYIICNFNASGNTHDVPDNIYSPSGNIKISNYGHPSKNGIVSDKFDTHQNKHSFTANDIVTPVTTSDNSPSQSQHTVSESDFSDNQSDNSLNRSENSANKTIFFDKRNEYSVKESDYTINQSHFVNYSNLSTSKHSIIRRDLLPSVGNGPVKTDMSDSDILLFVLDTVLAPFMIDEGNNQGGIVDIGPNGCPEGYVDIGGGCVEEEDIFAL